MAEIRYLENRNDVIFFCRGWSDLENISQTVAEWHVGCGDMVKLETRCRIPIWRTFARSQWHVIAEPRIALHHVLPPLHGAATCWIHCHDSTATCHIAAFLQGVRIPSAILKIIFRRIFFAVFNAVWALTSAGYRIVSDTLVWCWLSQKRYYT